MSREDNKISTVHQEQGDFLFGGAGIAALSSAIDQLNKKKSPKGRDAEKLKEDDSGQDASAENGGDTDDDPDMLPEEDSSEEDTPDGLGDSLPEDVPDMGMVDGPPDMEPVLTPAGPAEDPETVSVQEPPQRDDGTQKKEEAAGASQDPSQMKARITVAHAEVEDVLTLESVNAAARRRWKERANEINENYQTALRTFRVHLQDQVLRGRILDDIEIDDVAAVIRMCKDGKEFKEKYLVIFPDANRENVDSIAKKFKLLKPFADDIKI